MTPRDYEMAYFAQSVWRLASTSDQNELLAVACTMRNWVIARPGSQSVYSSYSEVCDDFLKTHPVRDLPSIMDVAFTQPPDGLLYNIAEIYDGRFPDLTSTHDHVNGARYFARVMAADKEGWFYKEVLEQPAKHILLGTWGGMQFYS